jgi:hypothetical protein
MGRSTGRPDQDCYVNARALEARTLARQSSPRDTMYVSACSRCTIGKRLIGKLPSRHIAHTVGPVYAKSKRDQKEQQLRNCYQSSLQGCKDHGGGSIGFSSISTGVCECFSARMILQIGRLTGQTDTLSSTRQRWHWRQPGGSWSKTSRCVAFAIPPMDHD